MINFESKGEIKKSSLIHIIPELGILIKWNLEEKSCHKKQYLQQ